MRLIRETAWGDLNRCYCRAITFLPSMRNPFRPVRFPDRDAGSVKDYMECRQVFRLLY